MTRFLATGSLVALALAFLVAPGARADLGPDLTIDATADRHPISPAIYGMNGADPALVEQLHLPVDRWGGNDKERYNWLLATKNTGRDWYYENIADCVAAGGSCNGADDAVDGAYRSMIARDRAGGGTTVLQVPLIGWVAKDRPLGHPFTCGFPKTLFDPQMDYDPWEPASMGARCGNGLAPSGAVLAPGAPTQTSVAFGPAEARAWVQDLVARFGDAAHGGVGYYELGNEPALWNDSHRDVHPQPTTFDELRAKSVAMATAIKQADPTAEVIGYSEWGWTNYFCSAADETGPGSWGCQPTDSDRAAHGGEELSAWYLAEMRQASETAGERLLDDFDLHYYSQGEPPADVTRALWDPSYKVPTWPDAVIRLIPRMHDWVDQQYPGTKLSLSEYGLFADLNATDTVQNTIIEADALGIFARERLDMAAMWSPPGPADRVADAFRLYRDYDGHGGRFGDTWVRSVSADEGTVAVYGARRAADGALTVAVLNKSASALDVPLSVAGFAAGGPAQVWRWTDRGITRQADLALPGGAATTTYPGRSMTMLVVPAVAEASGPGGDPPVTTPADPPAPTTPADPPAATTPAGPPAQTILVPPPLVVPPLARLTSTRATLRGRTVDLRVACPRGTVRCGAGLALTTGRTTLGRGSVSLAPGRTSTVRLRLSRSAARAVARYGRSGHTVQVTITAGKRVAAAALRLRGR